MTRGTLSDRLNAEVPDQVGHSVDAFVGWLDDLDEPVTGAGDTVADVLAMSTGDFANMALQAS